MTNDMSKIYRFKITCTNRSITGISVIVVMVTIMMESLCGK